MSRCFDPIVAYLGDFWGSFLDSWNAIGCHSNELNREILLYITIIYWKEQKQWVKVLRVNFLFNQINNFQNPKLDMKP